MSKLAVGAAGLLGGAGIWYWWKNRKAEAVDPPPGDFQIVVNSLICDPKAIQRNIDYATVKVSITNIGTVGGTAIVPVVVTRREYFNMVYKKFSIRKYIAAGETTDVDESFLVGVSGYLDCCVGETIKSHLPPAGVCDWFHVG